MRIVYFILFLFLSLSFKSFSQEIPKDLDSAKVVEYYKNLTIDLSKVDNPQLYFEIYRWLKKPYLLGGNTEHGIDCSNFVRMLYNRVYQKDINGNAISFFPQCSSHQYADMSAEGDLIFFNINSSNISHVAIYLRHGKFAHVTVHGGVMVSDINENYWAKYFYKAARPQDALSMNSK